jgi:hypothetical protein
MHSVHLRRMMLVGLAKNYDIGTQNFRLCGKEIPMTPLDVLSYYGSEHRRQNNRHK